MNILEQNLSSDLIEQRLFYPRVTDIIGKQNASEFSAIPIDTLISACTRGQKVHAYCTAWLNNLWVSDIEPEYSPYFTEFVKWAEANVQECLFNNIRLYDDVQRFTGEFDLIVKLKSSGKIALVDIKTSSSKSKTWPIQLSAYSRLCKLNGYEIETQMIVHLQKVYKKKNEEERTVISPLQVKANITEYKETTSYWEIFSSALNCYDYFDRKEKK